MRIAIYEPERINGGTSTWVNHLKIGLTDLNHDVDIVTFTKSGRTRSSWKPVPGRLSQDGTPISYDQVTRYSEAAEFLNGFDGVILSDFVHPVQDGRAKRGISTLQPDLPDYVSVICGVTVPTTVAIHTSDYSAERQPYVDQLLEAPGLTGWYVANSEEAVQRSAFAKRVLAGTSYAPLPFAAPSTWPRRAVTSRSVVSLAGRYSPIKGHRVLAAAAAYGYLPDTVSVNLDGSSDLSPGPAPSGRTFDVLSTAPGVTRAWVEPGSAYRDRRWTIEQGDRRITYSGPFHDARLLYAPSLIHCNLTTTSIPGGSLEYTQLESMAAGCLQVALGHRWNSHFIGAKLTPTRTWASDVKLSRHHKTIVQLRELGTAVGKMLDLTDVERQTIIDYNRETLRTLHDPETIARYYVDALTNGKRN